VQNSEALRLAAIYPDRKPWLADEHVQGGQQELRDLQRSFVATSLKGGEDLVG
jgi:hypothetical protein